MAISYRSVLHDSERVFSIAMDRYEGGLKEGVLYHGEDADGLSFVGYAEMARLMERFFKQMLYPRPVMDQRIFRVGKTVEESSEGAREHGRRRGAMATFRVRVRQRQNASWQGIFCHEETGEEVHFTSFLELICLMDAALSGERYAWSEETGRDGHQQRLEKYLRLVMDGADTFKILPDTLVYRFWVDGRKRTFMIRPMFYEHNTCQGTLYWKESKKQSNFRSFLELIGMMREAVRAESDGEWEEQEEAI